MHKPSQLSLRSPQQRPRPALAVGADGVAHLRLELRALEVVLANVQEGHRGEGQLVLEVHPGVEGGVVVLPHVEGPDVALLQHPLRQRQHLLILEALRTSTGGACCG